MTEPINNVDARASLPVRKNIIAKKFYLGNK